MPTVDTKITAVSVFPDRARVTRTGRVTVEVGAQTVTVAPLPLQMDESSLRAAGKGNARLTGVQTTRVLNTEAQGGPAKDAQDKLQALLDQAKVLADEQDTLKARLTLLKQMGEKGGENFSRSVARGKLSLEALTDVLDYMGQKQAELAEKLRKLDMQQRELDKEIAAAKQKAEKLLNAAALETICALVSLEVTAAGEVEIELSYSVWNASWNALYDARLDGTELEWNYLAQVQQQTGEDWTLPYALTLSTASLATGLDKPELPPWRVDAYQPPMPRMMQARGGGPMMAQAAPMPAAEMAMANAPAPMQKMMYDEAEVESSGASVTYKIATPREIPSDGEPHQVAITTLQVEAKIDYFCAPKADPHAFIRAEFTNPSDYMMLGGQVNLYHGADFVGTRNVETIVPKEKVEFFLGAEERIDVERKETKRAVDKSFIGNTGRTALAYKITIQNPALDAAHITVLDQIPVSAHPDIKVKVGRIAPEATPNEQGELKWERDLKRGDKAEFEFEVTVEYPKELRVVGL